MKMMSKPAECQLSQKLGKGKKIILFDGDCNLCNKTVQYIIKHDKKDEFRFTSFQSDLGRALLLERGRNPDQVDTVIMIEPGVAYYVRSTAALEITKRFGGLWYLSRVLLLIPESIRDSIYCYVAKKRYSWFGKQDHCMVPTPELRAKFLT